LASAGHRLAGFAEGAAASLFFTFFPANCRICGCPLHQISRLPVCESCLAALHPLSGSDCPVCGQTAPPVSLPRHERRENLRGAFGVNDPTRILNRDILLVDDVYSTGTTASEYAGVLLRAGAASVWVATLARTLKLSNIIELAGHLADARTNDDSPDARPGEGSEDSAGIAAHG
jgi:predicted amidophosphoribosyltransferase